MKKFNALIPLDILKALDNIPDIRIKQTLKASYLKSLPKMVEIVVSNDVTYGKCPVCEKPFIESYNKVKFCPNCGQKIIFPKINKIY